MTPVLQAVAFTKMTGCGNDFIIIDNRRAELNAFEPAALARSLCRRRLSVGADGLILIETDPEVDFRWRFFNCDGSEAEMCGNGARCAARYAFLKGIVTARRLSFRTLAGIIRGEILSDSRVKVRMTSPLPCSAPLALTIDGEAFSCHSIDTGVPHAVVFLEDAERLRAFDLDCWGRALRRHAAFAPQGTNVDFVAVLDSGNLAVRTYERGVEQETLACGTGAIAAALIASNRHGLGSPLRVTTSGGEVLTIHFQRTADRFTEVYLEGEAKVVYEGQLGDPLTVD
ncbi:MAG: diaminopimelate epimerase [Syntrophobacteraceae bacterium CG2_30_61_12]|nr:MAG: diaminopimelate epimerase [Syntrophobacteraceae bacterium CG2_30_61_12]